jgi:hypothetical protein
VESIFIGNDNWGMHVGELISCSGRASKCWGTQQLQGERDIIGNRGRDDM